MQVSCKGCTCRMYAERDWCFAKGEFANGSEEMEKEMHMSKLWECCHCVHRERLMQGPIPDTGVDVIDTFNFIIRKGRE